MKDDTPTLTPEQFGDLIQHQKPYLIELERAAQGVGYGEIEVKLYVRGGVVEKMQFWSGSTWLKDKS